MRKKNPYESQNGNEQRNFRMPPPTLPPDPARYLGHPVCDPRKPRRRSSAIRFGPISSRLRRPHSCHSRLKPRPNAVVLRRPVTLTASARRLELLIARSPAEVDLLGEGDGGIIVGDLAAGRAVGAREGNAVVDVEDAVGAAWREDEAGGGDLVVLGVDLAGLPGGATLDGCLGSGGRRGVLAEVVRAVEGAGHALLELRIAVVRALDDGELEATGVPEVQVQLAVLGLESRAHIGSDVGLEPIEAECDDRLIGRDAGGHGALRAAIAREGDALDLDILGIRLVRPTIGDSAGANGAGEGKGGKEERDGTHFDI